jgi:hypothetical protein
MTIIRIYVVVAEHPHLGVLVLIDVGAQIARVAGAGVARDGIRAPLDDEQRVPHCIERAGWSCSAASYGPTLRSCRFLTWDAHQNCVKSCPRYHLIKSMRCQPNSRYFLGGVSCSARNASFVPLANRAGPADFHIWPRNDDAIDSGLRLANIGVCVITAVDLSSFGVSKVGRLLD